MSSFGASSALRIFLYIWCQPTTTYQPTTTTRGSIDTTQSTRRRGHCEFQTLLLIPVCRRRVDISPEMLGVWIMSRCSSELSTLLHHPPHNQSTMHVAILPGLGPQLAMEYLVGSTLGCNLQFDRRGQRHLFDRSASHSARPKLL